jgi:hypothetical protein
VLARQTVEAVRPAGGSVATSIKEDRWKKCSTETPGVRPQLTFSPAEWAGFIAYATRL